MSDTDAAGALHDVDRSAWPDRSSGPSRRRPAEVPASGWPSVSEWREFRRLAAEKADFSGPAVAEPSSPGHTEASDPSEPSEPSDPSEPSEAAAPGPGRGHAGALPSPETAVAARSPSSAGWGEDDPSWGPSGGDHRPAGKAQGESGDSFARKPGAAPGERSPGGGRNAAPDEQPASGERNAAASERSSGGRLNAAASERPSGRRGGRSRGGRAGRRERAEAGESGWLPDSPQDGSPAASSPEADPESVARAICLRLLTMAPKTRAQLEQALRKREVPEEAARAVLDRFSELGLINDEAFAEAWVDSRHHGRGLAKRALAAELRQRGVDSETVSEAVERLDPDQEAETARRLVERKLASTRNLDAQTRTRRLAGMLARKGYSSGLAFRVIKEALEQEGIEVQDDF